MKIFAHKGINSHCIGRHINCSFMHAAQMEVNNVCVV